MLSNQQWDLRYFIFDELGLVIGPMIQESQPHGSFKRLS
jgi:hypothetical protein